MEQQNGNFDPKYAMAELATSWHIPRPTLARGTNSSQSSTSSTNSTQSVHSGSLLLTAANLAQIHEVEDATGGKTRDENLRYFLKSTGDEFSFLNEKTRGKDADLDSVSVASSTHFTVVNVSARPTKPTKRSCCKKHQLTVLVVTMSALFMLGILAAIFLMEMRARRQLTH